MLSFSDSTENLFNRLGRLGKLIHTLKIYQDTLLPVYTDEVLGLPIQYLSEPDLQAQIGSDYLSLLDAQSNLGGFVQSIASQTVNRMIFRDNPQPNQILQSGNLAASLIEVITQMKTLGATVLAMSIGSTNTNFSGAGNAVINSSVVRPFDGLVLENSFAEKLTLTCINDSVIGTSTQGNESILVSGVGAESNLFSFDWPLGSNTFLQISSIDGSANNSSSNLLTNSGFETFSGNLPTKFIFDLGTGGVNVFKETSLSYDPPPNFALRILGDGSSQIQFRQKFNNSSGTLGKLLPQTQYSFNIFMRRDALALGAGVMEVSLVDDGGVYLQDVLGNNQVTTFNLVSGSTALTTDYLPYKCTFMCPKALPTNQYLRVKFSTPVDLNKVVYLDKMSLGVMSQTYISGPFVATHSGNVPLQIGDKGSVVITNSRGAGGSLSTWQTFIARLFPNEFLYGGLILPSSSVPSLSDLLLTRS